MTELKRGDKGPAVGLWQAKLNKVEPSGVIKVDNDFGSATEKKTKSVQSSIFAHGRADALTDERIEAMLALIDVTPAPVVIVSPGGEPSYIILARTFLGTKEIFGAKDNPVIVEFFSATSYWSVVKKMLSKADEVAWCAAFTNWVIRKSGYRDANSAAAKDSDKIGTHIPGGAPFCVAVWQHLSGSLKGRYHTNFLLSKIIVSGKTVGWKCIGGNQSDGVTVADYYYADYKLVHAGEPEPLVPVLPAAPTKPNPDVPLSATQPPLVNLGSTADPDFPYLWTTAKTKSDIINTVVKYAKRISANRSAYEAIAAATDNAWWVPGLIHYREDSSLSLDVYLHNGEKLGKTTTLVPKGVFFEKGQFVAAGIDALRRDKVTGIRTPVAFLQFAERFNGLGYRKRGIYSPYLWSGTQHYAKGKYVADGQYSSSAVDKQLGVAALLKEILA